MVYKRGNIILISVLMLNNIAVNVVAKEVYFNLPRNDNESAACAEESTNIFKQIVAKYYKTSTNSCDRNAKSKGKNNKLYYIIYYIYPL
ncbi:hypothetical protein QLX08_007889 [Tetragonisca angustula]|uniref:Uncharacterized protein n=1 Tax=Tetragonisca angustula TaxID=166442 RepID=A0AAW0ZMW2_9HYME